MSDTSPLSTCPGCGWQATIEQLRTHWYDKYRKADGCARVARQSDLEERYRLGAGGYEHLCSVCRVRFYSTLPQARYCGRLSCRYEAIRRARAARVARGRERVCRQCQATFTATRRDGDYCRPACRQAAYRARRRDGSQPQLI